MSWRETSDFSLKNLEKFFPACSVGANNKVSFEITEFWRNFVVKKKKVLKFLPTYVIIKIVKARRQ